MFYDFYEIPINLESKKDVMKTVRAFEEKINEYADAFKIFADNLQTKSKDDLEEERERIGEILWAIDHYLARNCDCLDVVDDPNKYIRRK